MDRRCRPLLCGLGDAIDVARPDGPLVWASRLLNGREDRADVQRRLNHASTTLGKCRAPTGSCASRSCVRYWDEKKYGKMYLESLRNGMNI